ncbi:MAG: sulfite exporter TauE/SafE family protein [Legionellales bacterium]
MIISTAFFLHGAVYALIGAFAGLMAGILGIGGGVVVVPGLLFVFQYNHLIPDAISMHVAAGTSLAVMMFTSQSSLSAHLKLGEVLWTVYYKLVLGLLLGTVAGACVAHFISTQGLKILFAVFLLLVALKMLTDVHVTHPERPLAPWVHRLVGFLVGFKSGLLGIGGGVLVIPYLSYCGVAARKIAAVSNLCTFTVAVVGSVVFMITGRQDMIAVPYATGYIYWPAVLAVALPSCLMAPLGAKLNYMVPVKQLKYGFIVMLLITAMNML